MDEQLKALVEGQNQLRAMRKSCLDFEKQLSEKIGDYCEKVLGFERDQDFSIVDVIAKVKTLD